MPHRFFTVLVVACFVLLSIAADAQMGGMGCSGMMCGMRAGMVLVWIIGVLVVVLLVVLIVRLLRR